MMLRSHLIHNFSGLAARNADPESMDGCAYAQPPGFTVSLRLQRYNFGRYRATADTRSRSVRLAPRRDRPLGINRN